jgi:AraC-like DNA-binding protein
MASTRREPTSLASLSGALAEALINHYGIDPAPLYRAAGLDPALIGKAGVRYPFSKIARLWEISMEATGDASLGLVVGQHCRPTTMQILGFAWLASTTLERAMDRWCRYHRIASTAGSMEWRDEDDCRVYRLRAAPGVRNIPVVVGEAGLAAIINMCRRASYPDLTPVWVRLRRPDPGQHARYLDFFGCPVTFAAPENAIAMRLEDLRRPLPAGTPDLAADADRLLDRMMAEVDEGETTSRVRQLLVQHLSSGNLGEAEVARQLNRSVSSLQRDLRAEGTSFRRLLEGTRRDMAVRLLKNEGRSIGQTAFMLGYSDQSTFTRAFRRWHGVSPGRFVREAPGAAP